MISKVIKFDNFLRPRVSKTVFYYCLCIIVLPNIIDLHNALQLEKDAEAEKAFLILVCLVTGWVSKIVVVYDRNQLPCLAF